jgi:hypothetical protein
MAAPPPPGPAQAPMMYYRDYFADESNDPFNGQYTQVMAPYAVPLANAMTPANVRNLAYSAKDQGLPTAFVLFHESDSKLHIYLQLDKFSTRMGMAPTQWDDDVFAAKGELNYNHQITVLWRNSYFQQTAAIRIPSTELINNTYAADPDIIHLGPYEPESADTTVHHVRNTCYVPPKYVPLFLAGPMTPRQAWEVVQTQIANDGNSEACAPLIQYIKATITRSTMNVVPVVAVADPIVPLADDLLLTRRRKIIETNFPALNQNLARLQQNQIAGQLGLLVNETRTAREIDQRRRAEDKVKTPAQYLGDVNLIKLLRYCNIADAAALPTFWNQISKSSKAQHLSILQWEISRIKEAINEPDLTFIATTPILEAIKSLHWEMTSNDSVTSGLNIFLFGDQHVEEAYSMQQMYELLHGDGANPTLSDAAALVKAKAAAPKQIYQYRQQAVRFLIINKIILGVHHPLCTKLQAYCNKFLAMESMLHDQQRDLLLLPTMLAKKLSVHCSNWYKAQQRTPAIVPPPNFITVFEDIQHENHWQPIMSHSFLSNLGLAPLHRAPQLPTQLPRPHLPAPLPVAPSQPQRQPAPAPTRPTPTPTPAPAPAVSTRVNNTSFNTELFQSFREAPTPCRIIRSRIRNEELPALPPSKLPSTELCLAWHVKGICNEGCSRKADHIAYTTEEYAPLKTWCDENYPMN